MIFNDLFSYFFTFAYAGFIIVEIFAGIFSIFYFSVMDRHGR